MSGMQTPQATLTNILDKLESGDFGIVKESLFISTPGKKTDEALSNATTALTGIVIDDQSFVLDANATLLERMRGLISSNPNATNFFWQVLRNNIPLGNPALTKFLLSIPEIVAKERAMLEPYNPALLSSSDANIQPAFAAAAQDRINYPEAYRFTASSGPTVEFDHSFYFMAVPELFALGTHKFNLNVIFNIKTINDLYGLAQERTPDTVSVKIQNFVTELFKNPSLVSPVLFILAKMLQNMPADKFEIWSEAINRVQPISTSTRLIEVLLSCMKRDIVPFDNRFFQFILDQSLHLANTAESYGGKATAEEAEIRNNCIRANFEWILEKARQNPDCMEILNRTRSTVMTGEETPKELIQTWLDDNPKPQPSRPKGPNA